MMPMNNNNQLPFAHLLPNVRVLDDVEDVNSSGCCGEVFAGFPMESLLSPLRSPMRVPTPTANNSNNWNAYCPCSVPSSDERETTDPSNNRKRNQELRTPIKRNSCHEKKDSVATVATLPEYRPSDSRQQQQEEHPLQYTPHHSRLNGYATPRSHSWEAAENDDANGNQEDQTSSPLVSPPTRKKLHIRRRSRQLMNLLLTRSNSMSSSTKDLSITETTSMETQNLEEEPPHPKSFDEKYVLTRRVSRQGWNDELHLRDTLMNCSQLLQCVNSEIWECRERETGNIFCVKTVDFPECDTFEELNLFHWVNDHGQPGVVRLVESFEVEDQSKLYIVMELMAGGNLLSKVLQDGPMEEERVKSIARSLVESCAFLHSHRVVHTDLEPANVLLTGEMDGNRAKIADFGSAVNMDDEPHARRFGNELYSAPEVLERMEPIDTQADMWSIGCLVYFMLTGLSPFEELSSSKGRISKSMTRILRGEYKFPSSHFHNISRTAKQFISSLIHTDPTVRMTATEALEHPWLHVQEKVQQQPAFFRHRLDSNASATNYDRSLVDSLSNNRTQVPELASPSPQRRSSSKHHRRLSSLTKGISKLFSPSFGTPAPTLPPHPDDLHYHCRTPKAIPHPDNMVFSDDDCEDLECSQSPSMLTTVSSWGGSRSERKTRKHHRRAVTK